MLIAMGVIPASEDSIHVPKLILALCGVVFMVGGLAVLFKDAPLWGPLAAAIILGCFASVGIWVGLFSNPNEIQGGIPFLPQETNGKIGKFVFLGGGVLCAAIIPLPIRELWAMRKKP
ncbi:MAG: hypothetical protein HKN21_11875 [Candidatus Eisenbacteria bacterium]|uniref:Uncharacterized protein n=1 Tax=Eiseniibacteriota bacterium TaxID=2212470 RepID=A0A7Y2EAH6_UNCEI|nr:hypothetical protein [Candidatus Eisenbacteria bacterium]